MTYLFWDVRHPSSGQSSRRGPPGRGLREAEAQNNQCRLASMMGLLTEAAAVNGLDAKSLEFWRAQELTDFHRVTTAVQLPTAARWRRPQRCSGCTRQETSPRRCCSSRGRRRRWGWSGRDPGHGSFERQLLTSKALPASAIRERRSDSPFKFTPGSSQSRRRRRNPRRS